MENDQNEAKGTQNEWTEAPDDNADEPEDASSAAGEREGEGGEDSADASEIPEEESAAEETAEEPPAARVEISGERPGPFGRFRQSVKKFFSNKYVAIAAEYFLKVCPAVLAAAILIYGLAVWWGSWRLSRFCSAVEDELKSQNGVVTQLGVEGLRTIDDWRVEKLNTGSWRVSRGDGAYNVFVWRVGDGRYMVEPVHRIKNKPRR